MLKLLPLIMFVFCYGAADAQKADSVVLKKLPVKTLSRQQYHALLSGEDLYGMALAGELNHYPSPDKVIKFKKELNLSAEQVEKLTVINKELHRKKVEMGVTIIHNERVLDSMFRYNLVDNGALIFYTNRYGLYQGELRTVILQACLVTKKILTPEQIRKFEALQKAD